MLFALRAAAAEVRFDGSYRLRFNTDTDLALDDTGFLSGQKTWMEHRLRLTPKIVEIGEQGGIEIQASFDILSGIVAGDVSNTFAGYGLTDLTRRNGLRAEGFDFRHLFTQIRLPIGLLQLGQMPSHWGMGMVTNSGEGEDNVDFGDVRYGDIVDRLLFATRPFVGLLGPKSELAKQLGLAVSADLVYRDRYANLVQRNGGGLQWGDIAWQFVSALIYDPSDATRAGLYVARRVETFAASGGDLHIWVFDATVRHAMPLQSGLLLSLEGEAAQIYGGTSHAPNLSAGSARVSQQGAALRVQAAKGLFEAELEGGYASGDADPFDDRASAFSMNRDYKVGLVLFDQVLMFQSQNAARRLSNPQLVGTPPPGLDLLPTEGAVTDAMYLKPTLRWKPPLWNGSLRVVGSVLFARAPQPVLDPYWTLISSAPVNAFGHGAGQNYGTEIDGAIGYHGRLSGPLGFEAGVQAGYLFPGNAFTRSDGSRMPGAYATRFRATFTF
ncbi:MAG TPA: hypothetical protein VLW85_18700 [Myxococcales bacterium]|nr:hypothetical protein [Myxococcales bacterium]